MAVLPYPFARLPKLSRRQCALLAALRTHWDEGQTEQAMQTARSLLGRELEMRLGRAEGANQAQLAARASTPGTLLLIEQAHLAQPVCCAVELSHQAAQQVVDLALGGDAMGLGPPHLQPLDELSRGALAYVCARLLAALGGQWTLRDIGPLSQLEGLFNEDCVVYPITLTVAPVCLTVRAYLPQTLATQRVPERKPVRSLSILPVVLVAHAGHARLPVGALRGLARGDVVVLDEATLDRKHGAVRGHAYAGLLGSRNQLKCTIIDEGLEIEAIVCGKELTMSTGHPDKPPAEAGATTFAADTPLELQVEIARFSLSLGELQRLQPGDVLVTGRRIGERVSLRVSGQTFAEAELVDVEGELGVRLLSFAHSAGVCSDAP